MAVYAVIKDAGNALVASYILQITLFTLILIRKAKPKMRKLSKAEQEKEASDIRTKDWPMGDVLLVKNLYTSETGIILRKAEGIVPDVGIRGKEPAKFNTVEKMVEAGWVAD